MPLVLGVDSSTQSTKVEIRDSASGGLVASGRAPHPQVTPPRSEQQPEAWWRALQAALAQAAAKSHPRSHSPVQLHDVDAVSIGGQQHGLVVLDGRGEVIRPAKLWNDTESAPEAAELVAERGPAWWAETVGSVPLAAFTVSKLAWMARHEPAGFDRIARVLLPHDWLTSCLTGQYSTDRGDASGTGYWSPANDSWCLDALELVGVAPGCGWESALPSVIPPFDQAGCVEAAVASELGLREGISVGAGSGDNMAGALGIALRPGDVAMSIGTSGTVYAVTSHPVADATGAVAGFADATGHFLPLVCTLNATQVTDAIARVLGVDLATLDALALTAPPGSEGVVLVPYLAGERTPNRPDATGRIVGLRTDATRELVARAAYEGVVCGLLDGLDALRTAGVAAGSGRLVLTGGGARSPAYRRILADLSGREVEVATGAEHVALGMCVQATVQSEGATIDDVTEAWRLGGGDTVEPDFSVPRDEIRARYAEARG